MPTDFAASRSWRVTTQSSGLAVGSPLGCVWAMMNAAAFARIAVRRISRGWTSDASRIPRVAWAYWPEAGTWLVWWMAEGGVVMLFADDASELQGQ